MGHIKKADGHYEYRQENGETTARFERVEEKMVLSHKGSTQYKKVFYLLIGLGVLYLAAVFAFVH